MRASLFDAPRRERWTGSRALVPLDRDACPECGGLLLVETYGQPALFVHGDDEATMATTWRWCPVDGWRVEAQRQEVRPWL